MNNKRSCSAAAPGLLRASNRSFLTHLARLGALGSLAATAALGCSAAGDGADKDSLASTTAALDASTVISTVYDDSASPVHIQIRACKSNAAAATHQVDCRVNAEYAVVGGGVLPEPSAGNAARAFVTESRPSDGRTWRASSVEPSSLAHDLTVYAIGLRLDGVNTQKLRDAVGWKSASTTGSTISVSVDSGKMLLGGGAVTAASTGVTGNRVLTASAWSGAGWNAQSRAQAGTVAGTTQVTLLQLDKKVIEGFGALEVMNRSGTASSTSGGTQTTTLSVQSGWALLSMGGVASTSSGTARRLTSIVPSANGRSVTVTTGDQSGTSAGSTTPYLVQVRKKPGSHGLCNAGAALASNTDSCVASICAARSQCCSSGWDATCVSMVTTTCGRSCAADTCVQSSFDLSKWQKPDGSPVSSNCYYYAQNKYPDAQDPNGSHQDPGAGLGADPEDFTPQRLIALAAGDGLIPSSFSAPCSENRTKVMFTCNNNPWNYHWLRQDIGGAWSQKYGTLGQAQIAPNNGVRPYTDIQNNAYEAFFCACQHPLPASP